MLAYVYKIGGLCFRGKCICSFTVFHISYIPHRRNSSLRRPHQNRGNKLLSRRQQQKEEFNMRTACLFTLLIVSSTFLALPAMEDDTYEGTNLDALKQEAHKVETRRISLFHNRFVDCGRICKGKRKTSDCHRLCLIMSESK
ncbi:uncharacterized protein [Ptychodera flava]|uniref:uncharacterized protein n=1 Tax=Ptychodera flava TaxID=63121 RepID=UPI00396A9D41